MKKDSPKRSKSRYTQLSLSAVEAELLWLSDSTRERLLANKIYNSLLRFFNLKDNIPSVLFLATIVSLLFLILKVAFSTYWHNASPQYPLGSILASFLISFSLATVKILHDIILPPNARKMLAFVDKEAIPLLHQWFASFLSYKRQILFSSIIGIFAIVTLYCVDIFTTAEFDLGDYFLGSLAIFCISHGGYCGLSIPTIAKPLCKGKLKLFWLNPADSEIIKVASWGFRLLSTADAMFVTLCIVTLYWFKPWESNLVALISGIWLVVGLSAVSYSFFYPHYHLNNAIKDYKKRQLEDLKEIIEGYYLRIDKLEDCDFKKMNEYIHLYERLLKSNESSIDISALRGYMTSVVIPTLSFVTGLIDFKSIISSALFF